MGSKRFWINLLLWLACFVVGALAWDATNLLPRAKLAAQEDTHADFNAQGVSSLDGPIYSRGRPAGRGLREFPFFALPNRGSLRLAPPP